MEKILSLFGNYKRGLIFAALLVITDVVREIAQPKLMSKIVDYGVGQKAYLIYFIPGGHGSFIADCYSCEC